ncbi:TraB/GumN family protein [Gilvimarinus polysaccharolyticus]|uniref:TraB/GumN family protein n=1 Tax=Gilvimarinus polysaccharolyticus TaxID=863921 RepID=UPI0006735FBB|nr:TraB/GumN family protein [Gilvimarinus polysaccharolyticus]
MTRFKGLLAAGVLCASFASYADSYVWQVSDGENKLFIGGTIHMLKPSDFPLPAEYPAALAAADQVVFEANMDVLSDAEFSQRLQQAMMLESGQTLEDRLNSKTWQRLSAYALARQLPLAPLQAFEPAFVALAFTMLEMQKLGFGEGIDRRYFDMAKTQGKVLGELETTEQQLGFVVAMTKMDPNLFINSTLDDLEQMAELFETMVAEWRAGDADDLFKLMGKPMLDEAPELYDVILAQRNKNWLPKIKALLATPEKEFILVGALHLAGPDSVLALLEQQGYNVQRYRPE